MTYQEQQEFNKLTSDQKEEYQFQQRKHPNWDHKKLMIKVGFNNKVDDMIENQGDVDVNDKDVMSSLVQSVGDWLERTLPRIWDGVKSLFSSILENILYGVIDAFWGVLDAIF